MTLIRGISLGLRLIAAVMSLLVLVGSGYAWATFRSFTTNVRTIDFGAPAGPKGSVKNIDGADQNILIVGDDSRQNATAAALAELGTDANSGDNTDTIMVLHVPASGTRATVISFPRDSLVTDGDRGTVKINSVFQAGAGDAHDVAAGARRLKGVVSDLTGLTLDHFVEVSMFGFYDISNALGGVDLELCAAQNASTEGDISHPNGYSGINLKQGWNHNVKGKQALAFVRQRHGPGMSDYTRITRQQYFLSAVFKKFSGSLANPFTVNHLVKAVSKSLVLDEELRQGKALLNFASQISGVTARNLSFAPIPMLGAKWVGDMQGEEINVDAMPAFVETMIGQPTAYEKAKQVAPVSVRVDVRNAGGAVGATGTAVTTLRARGFVTTIGESDPMASTIIRYPAGMEAQAKTLARFAPGVPVIVSSRVKAVTLLLGRDGNQLGTTASTPAGNVPTVHTADAFQKTCVD